ncbi:hypothetical protein PR048_002822 [Dryococelus australis]|uniref:Cytochrome P450 n=1 Tax=Dryococelus australis TaxID=614101 RepID=A0ABQ9ILC4_9NEOP|nr:hypothetical protein PR048_002822 [Dryococelus australis]
MEQRRNARRGKWEITEETRRPTASPGRESHVRKSGSNPALNLTRLALVGDDPEISLSQREHLHSSVCPLACMLVAKTVGERDASQGESWLFDAMAAIVAMGTPRKKKGLDEEHIELGKAERAVENLWESHEGRSLHIGMLAPNQPGDERVIRGFAVERRNNYVRSFGFVASDLKAFHDTHFNCRSCLRWMLMSVQEYMKRLCMKHIGEATARVSDGGDMSILQQVLSRTGDPKMAAVLAMDLFLVGVDTVTTVSRYSVLVCAKNHRSKEVTVRGWIGKGEEKKAGDAHRQFSNIGSNSLPLGDWRCLTYGQDILISNTIQAAKLFNDKTTSVAVTSTMYQLSRNPEQQESLFRELEKVLPSTETPVDWNCLENVPFLRACLKETLRMYPVIIGNGRSLQSEMIIGGFTIPKGQLPCSPPTKAIRVQSPTASLRIFTCGNSAGRCHLSAGFLRDLPFPPPFRSYAAPYTPQSPSLSLKTSMLRAIQISSLTL